MHSDSFSVYFVVTSVMIFSVLEVAKTQEYQQRTNYNVLTFVCDVKKKKNSFETFLILFHADKKSNMFVSRRIPWTHEHLTMCTNRFLNATTATTFGEHFHGLKSQPTKETVKLMYND